MTVALFGKEISADVISLIILRCDHPGFRVVLNPVTGDLMKRGEDRDTYGKGRMTMMAKTGVMQPQAKDA